MDNLGVLGFIFGLSGTSFAIIAWSQMTLLKKELDDLKKTLTETGVLKQNNDPKST